MICRPCRGQFHASCDNTNHGGGNWCDCQHKPRDEFEVPGWPGKFTIYGTLEG